MISCPNLSFKMYALKITHMTLVVTKIHIEIDNIVLYT